ncbi:hypothetical protein [Sinorhizobium sp. BJ1]|uniref:hypothetical protein n=1 Tax=Sinorhizobium sp. BJ1 TaxID=2035455 RepID=UPI001FDEF604|nr:hypothetical protein [Sinorhizobium sp. BJ1]
MKDRYPHYIDWPTYEKIRDIGRDNRAVPFTFERVGDETVTRIDKHEAALSELGFRLGAFDRATAQPICLFMTGLDLFADFEREFDCRRRHLLAISMPMASSTGGPAVD